MINTSTKQFNNETSVYFPFKPGTLVKLDDNKWSHIGIAPLDLTDPDLRNQAIKFKSTDFWSAPKWLYNKFSPPMLYLSTTLSPISPARSYPSHDVELVIHKFLHEGRIWIHVTTPDQDLRTILKEAQPKKRSIDLYLKAKFGDLYNPTDWEP